MAALFDPIDDSETTAPRELLPHPPKIAEPALAAISIQPLLESQRGDEQSDAHEAEQPEGISGDLCQTGVAQHHGADRAHEVGRRQHFGDVLGR
jgi:hypothetical protein